MAACPTRAGRLSAPSDLPARVRDVPFREVVRQTAEEIEPRTTRKTRKKAENSRRKAPEAPAKWFLLPSSFSCLSCGSWLGIGKGQHVRFRVADSPAGPGGAQDGAPGGGAAPAPPARRPQPPPHRRTARATGARL